MASFNNIADFVADRLGKPLDAAFKEDIKFAARTWGAFLIRQDYERNGSNALYLRRFVVRLVKVDAADTCGAPVDCLVLRSEFKIPSPVRIKSASLFEYVGSIDWNYAFTPTKAEELQYTRFNKYTSDIIRYDYINGYIYVFNAKRVTKIGIKEVPVNPAEIVDLCANGGSCITDDESIPYPEDMVKTIVEGLLSGLFKISKEPEPTTVEVVKE